MGAVPRWLAHSERCPEWWLAWAVRALGEERGACLLQITAVAPQQLLIKSESCRLPSTQPVPGTDPKKATEGWT